MLNKPNVRSNHLLLQPHIRQGGDREREREEGGVKGGKVEEDGMRTVRNNESWGNGGKMKGVG